MCYHISWCLMVCMYGTAKSIYATTTNLSKKESSSTTRKKNCINGILNRVHIVSQKVLYFHPDAKTTKKTRKWLTEKKK